jgi:hypothetical protein
VALKEAWPVWLLIAGLGVSWLAGYFLASFWCPSLETQVRYAGVMFDFLGFGLVAYGINRTLKRFGRPSPLTGIAEWFRLLASAFTKPQHPSIITGTGRFNLANPVWTATGTVGATSLEGRVAILERTLQSFQQETRESTRRLDASLAEVGKSIEAERDQRTAAINSTSRQIEELAVGGLQLEIVGLIWLLLGTLLTNIPAEISRLIM